MFTMTKKKAAALAVTGLACVTLSGCGGNGFAGSEASTEKLQYVVDHDTGLCFSVYGMIGSERYSHTWVPATKEVVEQLKPEERKYVREVLPTRPFQAPSGQIKAPGSAL